MNHNIHHCLYQPKNHGTWFPTFQDPARQKRRRYACTKKYRCPLACIYPYRVCTMPSWWSNKPPYNHCLRHGVHRGSLLKTKIDKVFIHEVNRTNILMIIHLKMNIEISQKKKIVFKTNGKVINISFILTKNKKKLSKSSELCI